MPLASNRVQQITDFREDEVTAFRAPTPHGTTAVQSNKHRGGWIVLVDRFASYFVHGLIQFSPADCCE